MPSNTYHRHRTPPHHGSSIQPTSVFDGNVAGNGLLGLVYRSMVCTDLSETAHRCLNGLLHVVLGIMNAGSD